nr:MAG TPA: putative DNA double strand break repair [Caudoviricetes sp.]
MKICIFGDVHWSQYSSIVRQRGEQFSIRLENLIQSMNWVEDMTRKYSCGMCISLGDFFDNSTIDAESITALREINWNKIQHIVVAGNHEMARADNHYSSANMLSLFPFVDVVTVPEQIRLCENTNLMFLPYVLEPDKCNIRELFTKNSINYMFSHNDLKDVNYGSFISKTGFSVDDISAVCDRCFNGHIHNEGICGDNIINVGNLTGQNFSEDATKYRHKIIILDTETDDIMILENPYAMNFYKVDNLSDVRKDNAVVTLKTSDMPQKENLKNMENVIAYKVIADVKKASKKAESVSSKDVINIDHLKMFSDYVHNNMGDTEIINQELSEVLS